MTRAFGAPQLLIPRCTLSLPCLLYVYSQGLNPQYVVRFFQKYSMKGWEMLGGVMLCVSGTETMFAAMGHFSQPAVAVRELGGHQKPFCLPLRTLQDLCLGAVCRNCSACTQCCCLIAPYSASCGKRLCYKQRLRNQVWAKCSRQAHD